MKKVLIVGAGFLQKFVIQRAKELGYYVLAVDADPKAPGFAFADEYAVIDIVDKEKCFEYARQKKIDGVMTAATDYPIITVAYIAEKLQLSSITVKTAEMIKNKYLVKKCLVDHRVDDSEQVYQITKHKDIHGVMEYLKYPVMVKPCDGSGSRGVNCCTEPNEFEWMCKTALESSQSGRAIIETFVSGEEYGAESFVYKGNVYVMAVMKKKMTTAPYYAELGHFLGNSIPEPLREKIKCCAKKAIHALGIEYGAVNMDILVSQSGEVHIVDVGARMGGNLIGSHIIPLGTGIDYMGNLIRICVGDQPDFHKKEHYACVATNILALSPGKIRKMPDCRQLEKIYDVIIEEHIQPGDRISSYHTNLDGCGYIVAVGKESMETEEKAVKVRQIIDDYIIREV